MTKDTLLNLSNHLRVELEFKGFSMVRVVDEDKWYCGYKSIYQHLYNEKRRRNR